MPELPEVETVRRGLEHYAVGRRVTAVVIIGARTVRRQEAAALVAALTGRRLAAARRFGKYLVVPLDDGPLDGAVNSGGAPGEALVIHLRMSGQLLRVTPDQPMSAHTHARLLLDDGNEIRFVDARTFGELFVASDLDAAGRPAALAALGPDPLIDGVDVERLQRLAASRRTTLKAFLLDQAVLAGIGNLYADEICFAARLRPTRPVAALRPIEWGRLATAIRAVLEAAVGARGSTLRDARYVDLLGDAGSYQDHHAVYGRSGEPCPRCGRAVCRTRVAGRSAHFCPGCQR